jgi:hypothetical protein
LLRITGRMPRSMVSTTSAWCSARARRSVMASERCASADGYEVARPLVPARGAARQALDRAADAVKPMKAAADAH